MAQSAGAHKGKAGPAQRRVPVRTCIGCQLTGSKRELVRVVHTPAGAVEVDPTGKKAGRGAYLHARRSCWNTGLKKKALERALKTTISPENEAALEAFALTLHEK